MKSSLQYLLFLIVFVCIVFSTIGMARGQQTSLKQQNEVVFNVNSIFNAPNFGFQYKRGIGEKTLLNFGLMQVDGFSSMHETNISTDYSHNQSNFGVGAEAGLEWRKQLSDILTLSYGTFLLYKYRFDKSMLDNPNLPPELRTVESNYWATGIGATVGLMFNLPKGFFLTGEFVPSIAYAEDKYEYINGEEVVSNESKYTAYFLSSQSIKVSVTYRWGKNE